MPIPWGVLELRELLRRLDVVGLCLNQAADALSGAAVERLAWRWDR